MAELLRDNIEAERRRAKEGSSSSALGQSSQNRREVPDILSWIQCFGMYACVVAAQRPEKIHQLLAYQTMVVREARRCGGTGWQTYDIMFRQQVANDSQADWSKLNGSLYSVTFLAQQNGKGKTCLHCLETDHNASECALAPAKSFRSTTRERESRDDQRSGRNRPDRSEKSTRICYSWNDGRCAVPYCRFRHACAKCQGEHKALFCTVYPPVKSSEPRSARKD